MIFTTPWFIFFAFFVTLLYWIIPKANGRLWFLGLACIIFHTHFAGPAGVLPIALLMIATYLIALTQNRMACAAGMALCVAALFFYKYTSFITAEIIRPWSTGLADQVTRGTDIIMPSAAPLAISFFAFEFVHYLYEVRRGGEPIKNPLKFLIFSIFFPSLAAGPIKRYQQFIPELEAGSRTFQAENLMAGLRQVSLGYFKKVLLADNLTVLIDQQQDRLHELDMFSRWMFLVMLGLRILFDFSGYSDMAIGFARMLGIRLPANFNWPYFATNIRDFWQRWHISLSSWIRDYIYIPLGGNRHGKIRQVANGIIAFGLCGLCHGPAWNFVLWGVYHGLGLAISSTYRRTPILGSVAGACFDKLPLLGWIITISFVLLGWLLFFYPLDKALDIMLLLFTWQK